VGFPITSNAVPGKRYFVWQEKQKLSSKSREALLVDPARGFGSLVFTQLVCIFSRVGDKLHQPRQYRRNSILFGCCAIASLTPLSRRFLPSLLNRRSYISKYMADDGARWRINGGTKGFSAQKYRIRRIANWQGIDGV